jgi:hypothetical protein
VVRGPTQNKKLRLTALGTDAKFNTTIPANVDKSEGVFSQRGGFFGGRKGMEQIDFQFSWNPWNSMDIKGHS